MRATRLCRNLPHPIPYQGSKRLLADKIGAFVPDEIETWFEPFAGSAALTLWAAKHRRLRHIVIGEVLDAMAALWRQIIFSPEAAASRYQSIWSGQTKGNENYFNFVRERFNRSGDPVDLLYLMCRCVKNAVRFNRFGAFTQSVDRRRLGMHPDRMASAIFGASALLKGRTDIVSADWRETIAGARPKDFLYLDPPYLGTSEGRDRRYVAPMPRARLVEGLTELHARGLRFALSYDGSTGGKEYGERLPPELCLTRVALPAGQSAQATLLGRSAETVESLYLHGLALATPALRTETPCRDKGPWQYS